VTLLSLWRSGASLRLLNTILAVTAALIVVLFAVSNREEVDITLWPLPLQVTLGVYAVVLIAVLVGFFGGVVAAWLAGGSVRRDRRRLKTQVRDMEQTIGRSRMKADES